MRALVAAFSGRNNVSWKYICPGKKLCFSLLRTWNSLVCPGERKKRIKFGDDNEIRISISSLWIKMVAMYLKLSLKGFVVEMYKSRGVYLF